MQLHALILIPVLCTVMYLLYRRGIVVTKSIAAILFVFRPGRNQDQVSLDSCTGWVLHAGRFQNGRIYDFTLDFRLSKGHVEALLLDKGKQTLLKLDRQSPSGRIKLEGNSRYYLRWEFQNATGQCELRWNETAT